LVANSRRTITFDDAQQAIERLQQALDRDPNFAEALAMMAGLQAFHLADTPPERVVEIREQAQQHAKRAVGLRPESCLVRVLVAFALDQLGDWAGAEREYRAALDLGCPRANLPYAQHHLAVGNFKEARRNLEAVVARDRIHPNALAFLLASHGLLGETDREAQVLDRGNALYGDGDAWWGPFHEAFFRMARTHTVDPSLARQLPSGQDWNVYLDSPRDGAAEVAKLSKTKAFERNYLKINLAYLAAFFDDDQLAMELFTAGLPNTGGIAWFMWMPLFHDMRQRPEFVQWLRDRGFVAYWDEFGWPSICRRVGENIACD
jgi:tetratricopeptide (TPR) repeat protein